MNRRTMEALNRLNRVFYEEHAEPFSATRRRPWPGWDRVVERLELRLQDAGRQTASILDLGCGNGRFGALLAERLDLPSDYCGVDASRKLLSEARSRSRRGREWRGRYLLADLVIDGLDSLSLDAPFDLIALFGLLHHLPSFERRRALLAETAGLLRAGGLLAVSFWQFGASERFLKRVIPWAEHNRQSAEKIALRELETGDLLLAWGEAASKPGGAAKRYCHFADPREAETLVGSVGLPVLESFSSDGEGGALNLYYLLECPG
ncbi:MAG: class I SAM-dependent methyltransferase [Thermoanaerobaculia bacterium]